jgi:hypothetical protein
MNPTPPPLSSRPVAIYVPHTVSLNLDRVNPPALVHPRQRWVPPLDTTYDFRTPPITIRVTAPSSASSSLTSSSPPALAPTAAAASSVKTPPASTPKTSSQPSQPSSLANPTSRVICSKCDMPISSRHLRALGGVFHAPCFTCLVSISRLPRLIIR